METIKAPKVKKFESVWLIEEFWTNLWSV